MLYLHAIEGLTVKQIAARRGKAERSVRDLLHDARKRLDAGTIAQAAIYALHTRQLDTADRAYPPRETRTRTTTRSYRHDGRPLRPVLKTAFNRNAVLAVLDLAVTQRDLLQAFIPKGELQ